VKRRAAGAGGGCPFASARAMLTPDDNDQGVYIGFSHTPMEWFFFFLKE